MPAVVPDVAATPSARDGIPAVAAFGIGAFAGVPVRLPDGSLYGTLCCLDFAPEDDLHARDARTPGVLAGAVGALLAEGLRDERARQQVVDRIDAVIALGGPAQLFQPIWRLEPAEVVGYETLSRFPGSDRSVEQWFADATEVGRACALDLSVVSRALRQFPAAGDCYLSINISPPTAVDPGFAEVLGRLPLDRVVVEITEHEAIEDYAVLARHLAPLRARGLRLAVDDAGAGYASMRHVLALLPEIIKIDRSLVVGVQDDAARQALVVALVAFAHETGATLVAEGIEQPSQLGVLRQLGVEHGQGFLLGRPGQLPV
jgi:EAL domain-containing protein (putative c-di-GMP-specific phosphodiesterase class I)